MTPPRPFRAAASSAAAAGALLAVAGVAPLPAPAQTSPAPSAASASLPASSPSAPGATVPGADDGIALKPSRALMPPPRGEVAGALPIQISAQELRGRPDLDADAVGDVDFRRAGLRIQADRLHYDQTQDLARVTGSVRVSNAGNVYTGPEAQLKVQRFEGFFLQPTYRFAATGAGGTAARVDFLDADRSVATDATYSSCTPDGRGAPDWLLKADRVSIDLARNEGTAEGAKLRFLDTTILAIPHLTFPLSDARKSGWLPPAISLDNKSGLQVAVPYYWNIAPNRDATATLALASRRGATVAGEYRYLEPSFGGVLRGTLLPHDRVYGRSRYAFDLAHDGRTGSGWDLRLRSMRVSDDDYWKDFPRSVRALSPRLLPTDLQAVRTRDWNALPSLGGRGVWSTYLRVLRWQPIQDVDPASAIVAPYERLPQIGVRTRQGFGPGLQAAFETEVNRFVPPPGFDDATRFRGTRLHAVGTLTRPIASPGWTLTPRVSFNAASYDLDRPMADGRTHAARVIPTASLDSAWVLERDTRFLGRGVRQTLEPRLRYVRTPYRNQSALPVFDAAAKDFNADAIYTDNAFSGIDRVSDANQLTAGATTRLFDPASGAELLRLGVVQRFLFSDQQITREGVPSTQRLSDLLLLGGTNLVPQWTLDGSLQYNPDSNRTVRSILSARYAPGPYRLVNATYRFTRGTSEQVDVGWQWPIAGPAPMVMEERRRAQQPPSAGTCGGSWYSVGRLNYSLQDRRLTDAIVGLEYDAGCWIGRIVAERVSTGRSEATARLLFQIEFVGLSRIGANPLQVLKDNIPGYRLLRDDRAVPPTWRPYD